MNHLAGRRSQGERRVFSSVWVLEVCAGALQVREDVVDRIGLIVLECELHSEPRPDSISKLRKYASYSRTGSTESGNSCEANWWVE